MVRDSLTVFLKRSGGQVIKGYTNEMLGFYVNPKYLYIHRIRYFEKKIDEIDIGYSTLVKWNELE